MTVAVAVGSGALVPGWGEGSTTAAGGVGEAKEEAGVLSDGAGAGVAAGGDAAGTATDAVPGLEGAGAEAAGAGAMGEAVGAGEVMETMGKGPAAPDSEGSAGTVVQPAIHRPKMRQAAGIAVVLFGPRPACMTAQRSCPSTCISNVRTGRRNTTCRYGDGSDKSWSRPVRSGRNANAPAPRNAERGHRKSEEARLLLLRPERRSGARRCP